MLMIPRSHWKNSSSWEFIWAECMTCGAVYQEPMPKPDQIASFYPDQYDP